MAFDPDAQERDWYGCVAIKLLVAMIDRPGRRFHRHIRAYRNGSYGDRVMGAKALPSPEVLRQLLHYEPETGRLFWKVRPETMFSDGTQSARHACGRWNSRYAGTEAFTALTGHGYRHGSISKTSIAAHRVVWALLYGFWPDREIDHINGVKTDNRAENLRLATHAENVVNIGLRADSSSGATGVYLARNKRTWYAQITSSGQRRHLGTFGCLTAAKLAYAKAAKLMHGSFRRNAT